MTNKKFIFAGVAVLAVVMACTASSQAADPAARLNLIPWPRSVQADGGQMALTDKTRIVAGDPKLLPLAQVLRGEISLATGLKLQVAQGDPRKGDIALQLNPKLQDEQHTLTIKDKAVVSGGNYGATALGSVTLLQALSAKDGKVVLPCATIADQPDAPYRGLMIDVARKFHSIDGLKQIVNLCRLYKVRYLQLHLTDDQAFTFPSKAYPQLNTQSQNGGESYTLDELKGLVAYADARNVTIIPEYDVPGHSGAANRTMPDLFKIKGTKPYEHHASINFAKPEVMEAIKTIVGEMCEVFQSSPYFHIGGDEADLEFAHQNADFQAAFKKYNLPDQRQLYRKFIVDMNEIVKKHGKRMIVWEGFAREPDSPVQIPKDMIVMAYEIRFYMPNSLVADGYDVINASWTPLYVVGVGRPAEEIYAWNRYQFKPYGAAASETGIVVPEGKGVVGAQMCAWEQSEQQEIPNERERLPAMMERLYNPQAGRGFADYMERFKATDRLLEKVLCPPTVTAEGAPDAN